MRRSVLAAASCLTALICLTGCNDPAASYAYFTNNTDQALIVKHLLTKDPMPTRLPPHTTTKAMLTFSTTGCEASWLIYDSTGTNVVKDPGEICENQTVTIP